MDARDPIKEYRHDSCFGGVLGDGEFVSENVYQDVTMIKPT